MTTTTTTTENNDEQGGLTQRAALLMGANVLATVMSLALPLVLVRAMSQAEYGLYKQAFQIMASALSLLNLQVAVSVFYFAARAPGKKLQVAHNVLLFYSLVGAFVSGVFLLWPGWVNLIFHGSDLVPHVPLLGLAILGSLVSTNLDAVPIAVGDVRLASAFIVVSQTSKAVVMIVAGLVFGSLTAILTASVIQSLLQTMLMLGYLRWRFGRFFTAFDWPLFKAQIGNALPFGAGGIVAIVQNDMHNYFVSHYFDAATFAIYAVGCFQLPLLGMLGASFAIVLNPELAKHKEVSDYSAIIQLWLEVIRKLAFFYVPTFALLLVVRHEFITALFTSTYVAAVPIFALNLGGVLLGMTVHLHLLRLFDELKYFRLKLYLALIPVTLVALYLGLQMGGLLGVAVAVLGVQTLDVGLTLRKVNRQLGMTRHHLRALAPILRISGAAVTAAVVTLAVRVSLRHTPVPVNLSVCTLVFGLVYLATAFAVGGVSEAEKAGLRQLWASASRYWSTYGKASAVTKG